MNAGVTEPREALKLTPRDSGTVASGIPLVTLGLASAVVLTVALPSFLVGTMDVDIMAELNFGPEDRGLLAGVFSMRSMVLSGGMGRSVERIGWSKAMRQAAATSAVASLIIGTVAVSPWLLGAALVIGGAANAISHPASNLALAADTSPDRQGLVVGPKHANVPGAILLAGLAVTLGASHEARARTHGYSRVGTQAHSDQRRATNVSNPSSP